MPFLDRQAFIDNILDHYENPRHRGVLENPTVEIRGGNPGCGDLIIAYLKVEGAEDRITDVRFDGEGCTISQASASILSEQLIGLTLADVEALDHEAFVEDLGREVVINRLRCATLALNTVKAAKRKLDSQRAEASKDQGYIAESAVIKPDEILTF
jgi:nitrogen fixation NifU-like protein